MFLTTLALIVMFASVFVLFSEEITSFVKKTCKNRTVRFVVPLFMASMLVLSYDNYLEIVLIELRIFIFYLLYIFLKILSVNLSYFLLGKVVILSIIALTPILLGKALNFIPYCRKTSINLTYISYMLAGFLWLIFAMLVIVDFPQSV